MKDWCTGFPEYWYQWYIGKFFIPMVRKVYIGDLCKKHDNPEGTGCSSSAFISGLLSRRIVGAIPIFIIASAACWVRYPKEMWSRL